MELILLGGFLKAPSILNTIQTLWNHRLLMASYHMDSDALVCYHDAVKCGIFTCWDSCESFTNKVRAISL